jgi:hypothetical protein
MRATMAMMIAKPIMARGPWYLLGIFIGVERLQSLERGERMRWETILCNGKRHKGEK